MNIVVLYGGNSAEREISLRSGRRVVRALCRTGHRVCLKDIAWGLRGDDFEVMRCADAVFLALHGGMGEDGTLQAELEARGIFHYTGSSPRASALAMRKDLAKTAVAAAGVPTVQHWIWHPDEKRPNLTFPAVIKPIAGGSSLGVRFAQRQEELSDFAPNEAMLCEPYLCGREFSVGVLGGESLPVVEIVAPNGQYDYERKYKKGACRELCPAPLAPQEEKDLREMALTAFNALTLRDFARIDFREDGAGHCFFLEANTLPGMTETSLLPLAARARGLSFEALCEKMLRGALARRR